MKVRLLSIPGVKKGLNTWKKRPPLGFFVRRPILFHRFIDTLYFPIKEITLLPPITISPIASLVSSLSPWRIEHD